MVTLFKGHINLSVFPEVISMLFIILGERGFLFGEGERGGWEKSEIFHLP